jgi:hypothetical protein
VAVQLVLAGFTGAIAGSGDGVQADASVPDSFTVPEAQRGDRAVHAVETPDGGWDAGVPAPSNQTALVAGT